MLVYGDSERSEDARALVSDIRARLAAYAAMPAGPERHQAVVAAFIRASELVQGMADAEFAVLAADEVSQSRQVGAALLLDLAQMVLESWDSGFTNMHSLPDCAALDRLSGAGTIRTKQAEGYAFYALYPEAYSAAARQSGLRPDTTIIGIRSIGAGLAAMVAAALGAREIFSVRPTGHPFDRRLAIGPDLAKRLLAGMGDYAIVDEGPGLSGSSFNGVADWLVEHGVAEQRIHFFPSHDGALGSAARDAHRQRWAQARKHYFSFEQLILNAPRPEHRLENWLAARVGPLQAPLQDLSGGAWRTLRAEPPELWPPADPAMEKRKFMAMAHSRRWLAKFVGIGPGGQAKLKLAEELAQAGFAPAPAGLCHGFLITPWLEAQPTTSAPSMDRLLDYLAFRAGLPADSPGASPPTLFAMAIHNFGEHWGEAAADAVRTALGDPDRFAPVPCQTDNRLHAWEWVHGPDGWSKLDGLDHHAGHDLVGCQDIAWDLAAAGVELDLSAAQCAALADALAARIGRPLSAEFLAANRLCYLAFQIGLWTMALARNGEDEQRRIKPLIARYGVQARRALQWQTLPKSRPAMPVNPH